MFSIKREIHGNKIRLDFENVGVGAPPPPLPRSSGKGQIIPVLRGEEKRPIPLPHLCVHNAWLGLGATLGALQLHILYMIMSSSVNPSLLPSRSYCVNSCRVGVDGLARPRYCPDWQTPRALEKFTVDHGMGV